MFKKEMLMMIDCCWNKDVIFFWISLTCICISTSLQQAASCNYLLSFQICRVSGKKPKHTFHLKRNCVSAAALSQHACFYSFYAPSEFLSPPLLHHWTMWPFSQWNLILLLYTQECFSPGEWKDKLAVLWLFLKFISLRHCLPWFSYRKAFRTSRQIEHTPFFLE